MGFYRVKTNSNSHLYRDKTTSKYLINIHQTYTVNKRLRSDTFRDSETTQQTNKPYFKALYCASTLQHGAKNLKSTSYAKKTAKSNYIYTIVSRETIVLVNILLFKQVQKDSVKINIGKKP